VVVLPHDERVVGMIPHAKPYQHNNKNYLLVPHRTVEVKILRNLGYKAPAPILSQYDWCNVTPFEAQVETAGLLTTNRRAYVLNSMGTGKTLAALFAADYLMRTRQVDRALVVAPLSTLSTVWDREIFSRMPHRSAGVLHGTREKRHQILEQEQDFYIINHDGLFTVADALQARPDINLVIVDELAAFRTANTRRWKSLKRVVHNRKFVWGMTGSPTPNAPTDAWGQCQIITPDRVPKYFKQFRDQTMLQITSFKWRPKREATQIVHGAMQPAVRFTMDQCTDIPPTTYSTREVALSPEQAKAYKEMKTTMRTSFDYSAPISAANAGVQMSKLLQICCGFAYDRDGNPRNLPVSARLQEVEDIIEEADGKVIVFVPFKHAVDVVSKALESRFTVATITGDTPKSARDKLFGLFQNSKDPQVLVAHPQVAAHGLTLTAANVVVWYSPTTSAEIYEQANARIPRPGQKLHTHIIHLQSSPVESRLYNALQNKLNLQGALLALYREIIDQ
jgi:SNF2 family DNA or RNA helicase